MATQPEGDKTFADPPPPSPVAKPFGWASTISECVLGVAVVALAIYLLEKGNPEGWRYIGCWVLMLAGAAAVVRNIERVIAHARGR